MDMKLSYIIPEKYNQNGRNQKNSRIWELTRFFQAYTCEPCNERFAYPRELRRHEGRRKHQRALDNLSKSTDFDPNDAAK